MRILRRYRCSSCGARSQRTFVVATPADIVDPACPQCAAVSSPPADRVAAPMIVGTKSRAVDEAWRIAQEDFGLTNMRDNAKEGETAFIPPPPERPDPSTISRPQMIWGGAPAGTSAPAIPTAQLLTAGRGAAALAKAEGRNPMQILHSQRPKMKALPVNRE